MYLVEQDGNDEVVEGKSFREVSIVVMEEEKSEDENNVLSGELRECTPNYLHTRDRQHHCSTTVCREHTSNNNTTH